MKLQNGYVEFDVCNFRTDYEDPNYEEEPTFAEIADSIYTHEWSAIQTYEQALDFILPILSEATILQRQYIGNIVMGRPNAIVNDQMSRMNRKIVDMKIKENEDSRDVAIDAEVKKLSEQPNTESNVVRNVNTSTDVHEKPTVHQPQQTGAGYDKSFAVYRLLQLADSIHDFDSPGQTRSRIDSHEIAITMGLCSREDESLKYATLSLEDIADIPIFMKYICDNPSFKGETNPFYNHDLSYTPDLPAMVNTTFGDLWYAHKETSHRSTVLRHVDVWCPEHMGTPVVKPNSEEDIYNNKSIVCLSQIASVITEMKNTYGSDGVTFIVDDSQNPASRLFMATRVLDAALHRVYTFFEDEGYYMDPTNMVIDVSEPVNYTDWKYSICDANIVDGQRHIHKNSAPVEMSSHATGEVSDPRDNNSFYLFGVDSIPYKSRRTTQKAYDMDMKKMEGIVEVKVTCKRGDGTSMTNYKDSALLSKNNVYGPIQDRIESDLGFADILHDVRACDWGQVEHCVSREEETGRTHVFVTSDRIAMMYAFYRNCNYFNIHGTNRLDVPIQGVDKSRRPQNILQLTCTMFSNKAIDVGYKFTIIEELINNISTTPTFKPTSEITPEDQFVDWETASTSKEKGVILRRKYDGEKDAVVASVDDYKLNDKYIQISKEGGTSSNNLRISGLLCVATIMATIFGSFVKR